ncbi:hypothetical protein [Metabacillus sp. 22489]|uniref:hypothetical protein n=1 Tax=Metabacillus sp. 22489 TaxID=3453928 RepID=UPI003F829C92
MKKERLDLLMEIYNEAIEYDNFYNGYKITNLEGTITDLFNYQYLEESGYIKIELSTNGKHYAQLTIQGVNFIEEHLRKEEQERQLQREFENYTEKLNKLSAASEINLHL